MGINGAGQAGALGGAAVRQHIRGRGGPGENTVIVEDFILAGPLRGRRLGYLLDGAVSMLDSLGTCNMFLRVRIFFLYS